MKVAFFITALLLFLTANYYVALRLYQLIPPNLLVRVAFITLIAIFVGSLFIFFPLYKSLSFTVGALLYRTGTAWIIAFAYFLLIFITIDLLKISNNIFQFMNKDLVHTLTHHNYISFFSIIVTVVLLLFIGNINYHKKRRVHFKIETSKLSLEQKQIRVVGISDLHLGYTIGAKELSKWVDLINKEKPDIVIIGGDLIDNNTEILIKMELDKILRNLKAPMGVYACLGNHEYISGKRESINFHERSNIRVLKDTTFRVVDNLTLIGREDVSNPNRVSLSTIVKGVDDSQFKLLLDHQPTNLKEAEAQNIDLQFSGHTHNGQIFPFSLIVESIFENSHGMIKKGLTSIYVSSGLGIWGGKFRIGTQSEYVVFDIIHKQK
ncbi:MAG: metallophosphoesterase [Dysgonamonadaceae bacterium]|nr:metallophosphoesterase [Dysgonamonadaceae bacterium]MDD4727997.1 metallophosphoesterase [Dysgonamonadaceae bacterium]